jgi:hypothetical protein
VHCGVIAEHLKRKGLDLLGDHAHELTPDFRAMLEGGEDDQRRRAPLNPAFVRMRWQTDTLTSQVTLRGGGSRSAARITWGERRAGGVDHATCAKAGKARSIIWSDAVRLIRK